MGTDNHYSLNDINPHKFECEELSAVSLASIAISLKRIADSMEPQIHSQMSDEFFDQAAGEALYGQG